MGGAIIRAMRSWRTGTAFEVSFELTPAVGVTESPMALEQLKGAAAGRGAGVSPR